MKTCTIFSGLGLLLACAPVDNAGALGDRCDGFAGVFICESGLVCAHDGTCQDPGSGQRGSAGQGQPCSDTDECLAGLVCSAAGTCQRAGVNDLDQPCGSAADCRWQLVCSSQHLCSKPGQGKAGSPCQGAEMCSAGLVCAGDATCRNPGDPQATGVAGPGESCSSSADCQLGLTCYWDGTCRGPVPWAGRDCSLSDAEASDSQVPFKIYFEVPRAGEQVQEFFRLPYPNDIRRTAQGLNLDGFPVPGSELAGQVVETYLQALAGDGRGFGPQSAVYMRFSKPPDFATVKLGGEDANFYLVDIDPDSPAYGSGTSVVMMGSTGRQALICQNWMALKPLSGYPLRPATTYALLATNGILSADGAGLVRDQDFSVMLADQPPGGEDLLAAWRAYQPLRDYLGDSDQAPADLPETLMAAAVFTTMDPTDWLPPLRDKILYCQGDDCSSLPEAAPAGLQVTRSEDSFVLLEGTVPVPVFQQGQAPYLEQGGGLSADASGAPLIQGAQSVALAISVPRATRPAAGWPLVIFAHGTGGSQTSFVDNGVAERLAAVTVDMGSGPETVNFAVLSIEGVQHGSRRGGSSESPERLYFNFLNPAAARGNAMQGAADNFQLLRLVEFLRQSPLTVAGLDEPLLFDSEHVYYFGHSQGSMTGPLFLAAAPEVKTAVLSGAGGDLLQSLLHKTQPLDVAGLVRLLLGDPDPSVMNPALNLLAGWFEPVDPVNLGPALVFDPLQVSSGSPPAPVPAGPKNIFVSLGRDDSYSPEPTGQALARALWLAQLDDGLPACRCGDDCDVPGADGRHQDECRVDGLTYVAPPLRANANTSLGQVTLVARMYLPGDYDGHFVLFHEPAGPCDYATFLATAVLDSQGIPSLLP